MAVPSLEEIMARLRRMGSPENVAGMARYGISTRGTLGVSVYDLRKVAKGIGTDHALAQDLWASGVHEGRLLAVFVDDPQAVTAAQMEAWAADFDSWDVCDQACTSLFDLAPPSWEKAVAWPARHEEFVKRGGFALMAGLAVHDKAASDAAFQELLAVVVRHADDDRNFVKKGASWALRNTGKRNAALHGAAMAAAEKIGGCGSRACRWIAADVLRELRSEKVLRRLGIAGP